MNEAQNKGTHRLAVADRVINEGTTRSRRHNSEIHQNQLKNKLSDVLELRRAKTRDVGAIPTTTQALTDKTDTGPNVAAKKNQSWLLAIEDTQRTQATTKAKRKKGSEAYKSATRKAFEAYKGKRMITFDGLFSRQLVTLLFLFTMLPSLHYHVSLCQLVQRSTGFKIQDAFSVYTCSLPPPEANPAASTAVKQEFSLQALSEKEWLVARDITQSMLVVMGCTLLLIVSVLLNACTSKAFSRLVPPLINQVALCGLLPLGALRMPVHPLGCANIVLYVGTTSLNTLLLTRRKRLFATEMVLVGLFSWCVAFYSSTKWELSARFSTFGLNASRQLLTTAESPGWYVAHFFCALAAYFGFVILAALSLAQAKRTFNALVGAQMERYQEVMGLDHTAYVVAQNIPSEAAAKIHHSEQAAPLFTGELNHCVTFVSEQFQSSFLGLGEQIEDLLFRDATVRMQDQRAQAQQSAHTESKESALTPQQFGFDDQSKWLGPAAKVMTLKQIMDTWNVNSIKNSVVFEVKTVPQLHKEREQFEKLEQQLKVVNEINLDVKQNARPDRVESQANYAVQPIREVAAPSSRSQSGQLAPVSRYPSSESGLDADMPLLLDAEAKANLKTAKHDKERSELLCQMLERAGVRTTKVFVRVKVKQSTRGGLQYRILKTKVVPEPQLEVRGDSQAGSQSDLGETFGEDRAHGTQKIEIIKNQSQVLQEPNEMDYSNSARLDKELLEKGKTAEKLASLLFKLIPDQTSHLSTIMNYIDGIVFNMQKLRNFTERATLSGKEGHISLKKQTKSLMSIPPHKRAKHSVEKTSEGGSLNPMRPGSIERPSINAVDSQLEQSQASINGGGASQSTERNQVREVAQRIPSVIREIDHYSIFIVHSCKVLLQILDTTFISKEIFQRTLDITYEQLEEGPMSLLESIKNSMMQIMEEKQVALCLATAQSTLTLMYYWRVYQSIIFHLCLWSINLSLASRAVMVEVSVEQAIDGILLIQRGSNFSVSDQGAQLPYRRNYSDEEEELLSKTRRYLFTMVYFEQDVDDLRDSDYRHQVKKDANFQISKRNAAKMGGHVEMLHDEHICLLLVILPVDTEIVDAFIEPNHPDHGYWVTKNKTIYSQLKDASRDRLHQLKSKDFKQSYERHFSLKDHNFTSSLGNQEVASQGRSFNTEEPSSQGRSMQSCHVGTLSQRQSLGLQPAHDSLAARSASKKYRTSKLPRHLAKQLSHDDMEEEKDMVQLSHASQEPPDSSESQMRGFTGSSGFHQAYSRNSSAEKRRSSQKVRGQAADNGHDWRKEIQAMIDEVDESDDSDQPKGAKLHQNKKFVRQALKSFADRSEQTLKRKSKPVQRLNTIKESEVSMDEILSKHEQEEKKQDASIDSEELSNQSISAKIDSKVEDEEEAKADSALAEQLNQQIMRQSKDLDPAGVDIRNVCIKISNIDKSLVESSRQESRRGKFRGGRLKSSSENLSKSAYNPKQMLRNERNRLRRGSTSNYNSEDSPNMRRSLHCTDQKKAAEQRKLLLQKSKSLQVDRSQASIPSNSESLLASSGGNSKASSVSKPKDQSYGSGNSPSLKRYDQGIVAIEEMDERKEQSFANSLLESRGSSSQKASGQSHQSAKDHLSPQQRGRAQSSSPRSSCLRKSVSSNASKRREGSQRGSDQPSKHGQLKVADSSPDEYGDEGEGESNGDCNCEFKVLLIDDQCYNMIPIKMQLKNLLRVEILTSTNGKQGLESFKRDAFQDCCHRRIAFVLMDLNMPLMDGVESATAIFDFYLEQDALSNLRYLSRPLIIAITAYQNSDTRQNALSTDIVSVLYKPIEKEKLLAVLREHLPKSIQEAIIK